MHEFAPIRSYLSTNLRSDLFGLANSGTNPRSLAMAPKGSTDRDSEIDKFIEPIDWVLPTPPGPTPIIEEEWDAKLFMEVRCPPDIIPPLIPEDGPADEGPSK